MSESFALGSAQGSQPCSTAYSCVEPLRLTSVVTVQPFSCEEVEWELPELGHSVRPLAMLLYS